MCVFPHKLIICFERKAMALTLFVDHQFTSPFGMSAYVSLLEKGIPFSVVINKCDILNDKYLAQNLVHQEVKKLLKEHFQAYEQMLAQHTRFHNFSA